MHNLAIPKPVAATFSCTRKLSSLLKTPPSDGHQSTMLTLIVLLLSGDIQTNLGPQQPQVDTFPCGYCQLHVGWEVSGIACDGCNIWFHQSCADLSTSAYNQLSNISAYWTCYWCNCVNQSGCRFHSCEIETSIFFDPLSSLLLLIRASQSHRLLHTLVRPPLVLLPEVVTQQGIRVPSTRDCWAAQLSAPPVPVLLVHDRPAYTQPPKTTYVSL